MNTYTMSIKTYKVNGQKRTEVTIYKNGTWINRFNSPDAEKNRRYATNLITAFRQKQAQA